MKHLLRYIITRLLLTIPMVFIMLTVVFFVLRIMPGDPVSAMLGAHAPIETIEEKKEELGLNRPVYIQYLDYLWQICRFDLGDSMIFKQPVIQPIKEKLPATLELSICGAVFTLVFGVLLGAYAADKRRTTQDYAVRLFGIVVYCIPVYWMGLMFQLIFGIWLDVLPIAGRTGTRVFVSTFEKTGFYLIDTLLVKNYSAFGDVVLHLVLPSITLGLVISGVFVRLTRANLLDVLNADYITAARARGIPNSKVVYKHGLKNALVPILTMLGLQFALLMAGAVLTETTFSWPGMGRLLLERIYARDYPVIQGVIIMITLIVAGASLLVDVLYALIDPRVRY